MFLRVLREKYAILPILGISLLLSGCGGPKYNDALKAVLEDKLGSIGELSSLKSEETSKDADAVQVKFKATFKTTEDLWETASISDDYPIFIQAMSTMKSLPDAQSNNLQPLLDEIYEVTLLKKTTPKGTAIEAYGTAIIIRTIDKWNATLTELSLDEKTKADGEPLSSRVDKGDKWLDAESSEGKKHLKDLGAKVDNFYKAVTDAKDSSVKAEAEKTAQAEAKIKEIRTKFAEGLSAGEAWQGTWSGARDSSGALGLKIVDLSNEGVVTGYFTNPTDPSVRKGFTGQMAGNGRDKPFILVFVMKGGTGYSQKLFNPQTRFTIVNLLGEQQQFRSTLEYNPDKNTLSGSGNGWNMGNVEFVFGKGASSPEGWSSNAVTSAPATPQGQTMTIAETDQANTSGAMDDSLPASIVAAAAPSTVEPAKVKEIAELLKSAQAAFQKGDLKRSYTNAEAAKRLNPSFAAPWVMQGHCLVKAGDYKLALKAYTQALETDDPTLTAENRADIQQYIKAVKAK